MTPWESNQQLDIPQNQVSVGTYRDWTDRSESFPALGGYNYAGNW
jgi:hypothetical protein